MEERSEASDETILGAVALRYDREAMSGAPKVVAQGRGEIAASILAAAEEAGVPIQRDADLLALLSAVDLGDEIPEAAFAVVAHLVSFLWGLNEERRADRA